MRVVLRDPVAFYLLVAASAQDIAHRCGKEISPQVTSYTAKAMSLMNKRMKIPEQLQTDGTISACAVLAGKEVSPRI